MDKAYTLHPMIEADKEHLYRFGRTLFTHPELGYKEFETRDLILKELQENGFDRIERYGETGLIVTIGDGKPDRKSTRLNSSHSV